MKSFSFFFYVIVIFFSTKVFSQSVSINTDGSQPHPSAILDVKSNTKGILLPRTSTTSRNGIVNPAKGLLLYDTTTSGFWFHNGSAWAQLSGTGNGWNLTGNSGTNPATNFIGTTDNQPLRFRVNNAWAGEIHPSTGNVFFGLGAGASNSGGQSNTAIGTHSLFSNASGYDNTANGNYALNFNTTGFDNTANGSSSLFFNTTGNNNTAMGVNAVNGNTTASQNTGIGNNALFTQSFSNGGTAWISGNTAIGYAALYANQPTSTSNGINNTAVGNLALTANTTGWDNTGIGVTALYTNTTGIENTAIGRQSLFYNTNGSDNTATGYKALRNNTTGSNNTANGNQALQTNTTGNNNTANGVTALYANSTGDNNTANGNEALFSNSSGIGNTASGRQALRANSTANYNTAHGYQALYSNTTGSANTATGANALNNNSIGNSNTANGQTALYANTSGIINTAIGESALNSNTTGSRNTAIGAAALSNNVGGSDNIAIGVASGIHPNTPNVYNTISIGNDDMLNAYQNQVFIGNTSTGFIGGKVPWSVISDERVKNNIVEDVMGLSFILKLRPVTYHINNDAITSLTGSKKTPDFPGKYDSEKTKYSGFLAQEVEQACKDAGYDFSGYAAPKNQWGFYTLSYEQFVVPLVKAVQEQQVRQSEITETAVKQQGIIEELKKKMEEMKIELELLKKKN